MEATKRRRHVQLARFGLGARGLIYLLVGLLALMEAFGTPGGRMTDTKGALKLLLLDPLGTAALALISAGLFCYAVWRAIQGVMDLDDFGRTPRGLAVRLGQVLGSAFYLGLVFYAVNLIFLFVRLGRHDDERHLVRWMFTWPLGDWMVGAIGIGIVLFGIGQSVFAWVEGFRAYIEIPAGRARWLVPLCKFGLVARGFVLTLVGWFAVNAAIKHRPREAGGFKEAWAALLSQPHGHWLVGIVALGFIAYAVFSWVEAVYRTS